MANTYQHVILSTPSKLLYNLPSLHAYMIKPRHISGGLYLYEYQHQQPHLSLWRLVLVPAPAARPVLPDKAGNYLTLQTAEAIIVPHRIILIHWPLMGGLLHLVQQAGAWGWLQPAQAPRCTKCNSPPINGQCTNHRIAV